MIAEQVSRYYRLVPGTGIEPVRTFYGCDGF
jgi:hypothetical protein